MGEDRFTTISSTARQRVSAQGVASLRALQSGGIKFLLSRLKSVFEQVDDVFFDLADRAENSRQQTVYFDAMRMIRIERRNIEQSFERALKAAFQGLSNSKLIAKPAPGANGLEIVDDDDLEEMIALDTMVSRVTEQCQPDLEFLGQRLTHLAEVTVTPKRNPLGPEVICEAFGCAIEGLPLDIRSKLVLLKLFERQVLQVLNEFVAKCNQNLIEQGVLPELEIRRKLKKSANATNSSAGSSPQRSKAQVAVSEPARRESKHGQVVAQLGELLEKIETRRAGINGQSGSAGQRQPEIPLNEVLSAVSAIQSSFCVDENSTSRQGVAAALQQQLAEMGSGDSVLRPADRNVVQLIDLLFEEMGKQPQASASVSQQLKKLEFPMLRVALQDHDFFDKGRHPARRLLNEVAQASMAFHDGEDLSKDPVAQHISKMAETLINAEPLDNATLTHMLGDFIELVERNRRRTAVLEQRLLEQVAASERVNEAHGAVNEILKDRLLDKELPQVFVNFAEKAWCKVLFMNYLRLGSDSDQLQTNIALLDRLLQLVESEYDKAMEMLGELLPVVRENLTEIAYDAYQAGCLIGGIEQYVASKEILENDNDSQREAQKELDQQIDELFKEVLVEKIQVDLPGKVAEQSPVVEQDIDEKTLQLVNSLRRGSWVECPEEEPDNKRCKVAGIVSPPGLYIFVNRRGSKVSEKPRYRVALEIKEKKLVVLDNSHLFDDVLENVIRDIRKKSAEK